MSRSQVYENSRHAGLSQLVESQFNNSQTQRRHTRTLLSSTLNVMGSIPIAGTGGAFCTIAGTDGAGADAPSPLSAIASTSLHRLLHTLIALVSLRTACMRSALRIRISVPARRGAPRREIHAKPLSSMPSGTLGGDISRSARHARQAWRATRRIARGRHRRRREDVFRSGISSGVSSSLGVAVRWRLSSAVCGC